MTSAECRITRDQRPETRNQEPGTRDEGPGTGDQGPETRDQGLETRDEGLETGDREAFEDDPAVGFVLGGAGFVEDADVATG